MKKLLIIQQDEAYFLFETLQVIQQNQQVLRDFDLTILVDPYSLQELYKDNDPLIKGITSNASRVLEVTYDESINLSLKEETWDFHSQIKAEHKKGPRRKDGVIFVDDLWSSYLMTLKAKAPFLTFHLQDVYKNILGIKGGTHLKSSPLVIKRIAIGTCSPKLFPVNEQESLIYELSLSYPNFPIKDISECDLIEDNSQTLYIGPATLDVLKFCESGGKCILLTSAFQGFNLIPHQVGHLIVSSKGEIIQALPLREIIERFIARQDLHKTSFALYQTQQNPSFGAYLKSLNGSDANYPFYNIHIVLWNFLLNLIDSDLEVESYSAKQLELIKTNQEVLSKYIRLHDYAMVSIETILQEAKKKTSDALVIEGHIKNLNEIEKVSDQIASTHSMLRPFMDFYRIRRGQNHELTLLDQAKNSILTYSEEHQALLALNELFSVTLNKNEVSI